MDSITQNRGWSFGRPEPTDKYVHIDTLRPTESIMPSLLKKVVNTGKATPVDSAAKAWVISNHKNLYNWMILATSKRLSGPNWKAIQCATRQANSPNRYSYKLTIKDGRTDRSIIFETVFKLDKSDIENMLNIKNGRSANTPLITIGEKKLKADSALEAPSTQVEYAQVYQAMPSQQEAKKFAAALRSKATARDNLSDYLAKTALTTTDQKAGPTLVQQILTELDNMENNN